MLQETKGGNTLSYVPGLAQHDSGTGQWSYFHADAQHNRVLSDGSAAASKHWDYDPFGTLRAQSGTGSSDFQYAGEQKDPETGLINLRARYYDPALGRFLARDALGGTAGFPQSYNRYSYGLNNPLSYVDPSGYCQERDPETGAEYSCDEEEAQYWEQFRPRSDGSSGDGAGGVGPADERDPIAQLERMLMDGDADGSINDLDALRGDFSLAMLRLQPGGDLNAAIPIVAAAVLAVRLAAVAPVVRALPNGAALINRAEGIIEAAGRTGSPWLNRFAQGLVVQAERTAQYADRPAGRILEVERRFVDAAGKNRFIDYVVEEGEEIAQVVNVEVKYWQQSAVNRYFDNLAAQATRILDATQGTVQRAEERLRIEFVKTATDSVTSAEAIAEKFYARGFDPTRLEIRVLDAVP